MPVLKVVTPPQSYPVSLVEAKTHLKVEVDDYNTEIQAMVAAATSHVEKFLGRALIDRTLDLYLDAFPTNEIRLVPPPIIEVISVTYDNENGNETTLDPDSYTVDTVSEPGWIITGDSWPATFDGINAVRVRFRAGYMDLNDSPPSENIPQDIKAALLLTLGSLYELRQTMIVGDSVQALPWSAEQILRLHRFDLSLA